MKVEIVPAQPRHIDLVLANLRDEFPASVDVGKELSDSLAASTRAFSGFIGGEIACVWGIHARTLLNDSIYLWLLTTRLVEQHPFVFVRHSQIVARELLEDYSKIDGWVAKNNTLSVKWLRWLGCTLEQGEPGILNFRLGRT